VCLSLKGATWPTYNGHWAFFCIEIHESFLVERILPSSVVGRGKMNRSPLWVVDSEQKEEEEESSIYSDDDLLTPSEARVEQMLYTKLAYDTADMGKLPGIDFDGQHHTEFRRISSSERFDDERRLSNLAQQRVFGKVAEDSVSAPGIGSPQTRSLRNGGLRLRTSQSMEKLDDLVSISAPRTAELLRRSTNLSQKLITSLKKSPSIENFKAFHREDNSMSPPPPPPGSDAATHTLGPRRSSNLTVMRLIAETI